MGKTAKMTPAVKFVNDLVEKSSDLEEFKELWTTSLKAFEKLTTTDTTTGKAKKDPNAPKGPKNAYMFFCDANRDQVREKLGSDAAMTLVSTNLGKMWKEFKENTKNATKLREFEDMAAEDKERFVLEKSNYTPSETTTTSTKKKTKDPNAPKGPKNAYFLFCDENREKAKARLGSDATPKKTTTLLGEMWTELKSDPKRAKELEKYTKLAASEKERCENEKSGKTTTTVTTSLTTTTEEEFEDEPEDEVKPAKKTVSKKTKVTK